jgi:hypothetical protein
LEKENFDSLEKENFDSLEKEIFTVWKGKFWQFGKKNLTFGKENFDSFKKGKFWYFARDLYPLKSTASCKEIDSKNYPP